MSVVYREVSGKANKMGERNEKSDVVVAFRVDRMKLGLTSCVGLG
jgi:hypothetical protein